MRVFPSRTQTLLRAITAASVALFRAWRARQSHLLAGTAYLDTLDRREVR
jgi:hypothetical protein